MPRHNLTPEERADRKARIVELRRQRRYWDTIGAEFDISAQRAHAIYKEALAERPAMQVDEHRAEEIEMIDLAVRRLMTIAVSTDPAVSPRTKVEAWSSLRSWAEWKGKLLGLPAPQQVQVNHSVDTDFDRAYAELLETMRERERQEAPPVES